MAVEIVGRGNVSISKVLLDAAFLTKMGVLTKLYENIFCKAISWLQRGICCKTHRVSESITEKQIKSTPFVKRVGTLESEINTFYKRCCFFYKLLCL